MGVSKDNGLVPLRWIGRRDMTAPTRHAPTRHAPVCIRPNSIAKGIPLRDLYVPPNHRLLIRSPGCTLYSGTSGVLSAAKFLTGTGASKPHRSPADFPITICCSTGMKSCSPTTWKRKDSIRANAGWKGSKAAFATKYSPCFPRLCLSRHEARIVS
jgi:hypothetical protein